MRGLDQVWVTSVLTNDEVRNALVLCYSLKRTFTCRRVAVIVSPKVSTNLREFLYHAFDLVFFVDEDRNVANLKLDDFTKLSAVATFRAFEKGVYLSPNMVALRNVDEIFDEYDDPETKGFGDFVLLDKMDTSIFLFKPSWNLYKVLQNGLRLYKKNGSTAITDIGSYLKLWTKNQLNPGQKRSVLHEKYNKNLQLGRMLLGNEREISIVKLTDIDPTVWDESNLEKFGLLGKRVVMHWLDIYHEDVQPLMECPSAITPKSFPSYKNEPIAIVGMSCRYPGTNNLEEFWNLLFTGGDGTRTAPPFRWLREQCSRYPADCKKSNAGFLAVPVDEFDAKFFGISPKEVLNMDPQHRLLHELVWEGLEDACVDPHSLEGTSGSVFVGSWTNDYHDILTHSGNNETFRVYMGNSIGAAAARISHLLKMTGPSVATESGCSSAMVAVHLACRSLHLGESNLALACGVNLLLHPFNKDEMPMVISPDGRCKTFCENANGFARAEGCGVLVLKRLSDAVKDGDNIWGLIRGSAIAQEGISKSMGTPTVRGESLAMIEALRDANVNPAHVSYVEAHGTGTVVGDPMEVAAIAKAYHSPERKEPLIIGSVKTNVGHTESCSGITGIMKTVLAMHHEAIPAHRNFEKLNPSINLEAVPAKIPLEIVEWKVQEGQSRLAGVSSFGITGTDAHVIVEEPPRAIKAGNVTKLEIERPLHILKVSGKTEEALEILLDRFHEKISCTDMALADICYAGNMGRADFNHRTVVIAKTREELVENIRQKKFATREIPSERGKVCFLFTGQGSQYPGMAKKLYECSPVFRMHFDHCEKILRGIYSIQIREALWGPNSSEISRTIYSQTSIFCVEYALFKLWESWGVKPDYVLGHSLGEFAAAVCSGILSVEDALMLVAERSRLIDELPRGKMLVIKANQQQVDSAMKKFSGGDSSKILDYAAINSREQTVVAGDSNVVLEFSKFCASNNMKCIVLEATHAFHSKHMDPMLEDYRKVASSAQEPAGSKCEYISGMRGKLVQPEEVDAEYWVHHTREKVSFLDASKSAVELGCTVFIEVGPQPVLSALTMMNSDLNLLCLPSLKKTEDEWSTILNTLGKLYLQGVPINWEGFDQFYLRKKVRLPHYPFIGKKFWPDMMALTGATIHPLIGSPIPNASSTKLFQCGMNLNSHEYIKDHAIGQTAIFPGAGYLEMCMAAGLATIENSTDSLGKPSRPMKVENLCIEAPLAVEESKTSQVQTVVNLNTTSSSGEWNDMTIKIFHRVESESSAPSWLPHGRAIFSPLPTAEDQNASFDQQEFQNRLQQESDNSVITQLYDKLASIGLKFGPIFRSIEKIWKEESNLLAKVKVPQQDEGHGQYIVHPAVLDAMIQSIMMLRLTGNLKKKLYVPIKIGKFVWLSGDYCAEDAYIYAYDSKTRDGDALSTATCTSLLLNGSGQVMAIMSKVEFIDTTVKAIEAVLEQQIISMPDLWEEVWRPQQGPLQNRINLELCNDSECYYSDEFVQSKTAKYNVLDEVPQEVFGQLEKLVYYGILRALYECGMIAPPPGSIINRNELFAQLGIQQEYTRLFGFFFDVVLREEGIVEKDGDNWRVTKTFPSLKEISAQLSSPSLTNDLVHKFNVTLLFHKVGENLSNILTGKQSPLYILFPDEARKETPSVGDFYNEYGKLYGLLGLVFCVESEWLSYCKERHAELGQKFVLRVLEVGAGTGMASDILLQVFETLAIEFEYTYTDISAAFFPSAQKRFEKFEKSMQFKKLNIEEDPISQGFSPEVYDLILASDVIHATKNIREATRNVSMLLKPSGRFDIQEMTRVNKIVTYMFGLLDGFWRFEDSNLRPSHCTISTEKWVETFESVGLEKINTFPSANRFHSFMCFKKASKRSGIVQPQPQLSDKCWLVFHQENSPLSKFLVQKIRSSANRNVLIVEPGSQFRAAEGKFSVRKNVHADFVSLIEFLEEKALLIEGVIYCWSLDRTGVTQDDVLQPYFYAVKSLLGMKRKGYPRLITLFDGIVPLEDNNLEYCLPSTLWGFTQTVRNETFEFNCRCLEIGGCGNDTNGMLQIFHEIWNSDNDVQVAYSGSTRYSPKFQSHKPGLNDLKLPPGTDRFRLLLPDTKLIEDLQFGALDPLVLADDDVEIQIKASALNFRDVFAVLKPSEDFMKINTIGFDFAGVVKRVGKRVAKWSTGDRVFGVNIQGGALPSHVVLQEDTVLPIPNDISFCDIATLPAVYTTVYYCLAVVAKVTANDTVLIHTASGGVGLCAIEFCKHIGAKIICTAGSKRKQNYLKSLGMEHIFHSRNTHYGRQILELTDGRGVDVVLNSLTSEGFKEATLMACAKNARFVEMSKLSIWQPEEVKKRRPDVDYTIVDVTQVDQKETKVFMDHLLEMIEKNVIRPIPYVGFPAVNIREALQYMQKAKHIGKIVCVMPEVKQENGVTTIDTPMFNDKGTYLITGGLGGIGFEVCKWMVQKGARYVLLAGRSAPTTQTQQLISEMNATHKAFVTAVQLDVGSFHQCEDLIKNKLPEMGFPQVRGIMHCAGTLNDGVVQNQDWTRFSSTLPTKVSGTINLHELTKDSRLEHFVLFSSIASLFGSMGQANHAAGNNFEDTFAHYRNSIGLPATTVNWGQWGQVGVATEVDISGLKPFSTLQGISALEYALKSQRVQTSAINIESFVLVTKIFPGVENYLDERVLKFSNSSVTSFTIKSDEFWQIYDSKEDMEGKIETVQIKVRLILKNILNLEDSEVITEDQNFQEMGVDSLMFVEIRNALQTLLGDRVTISASALRNCTTMKMLSDTLVKFIEGNDSLVDTNEPPSAEEVSSLIREDAVLPAHICAKEGQRLVSLKDVSCVLLTGCTGTLGPYMLRELVRLPHISEVVCLIRTKKGQSGNEKLQSILAERNLLQEIDMKKVSCVRGDVGLDHLGMEPIVWEDLSGKVEAIVHCAASVQHIEHYRKRESLEQNNTRRVNIGGTKNVLEFSCSGNLLKHVFHISTLLAVAKVDENGAIWDGWQNIDDFDNVTTFSYPNTKFVSDVLIKEAVQQRGIPAKVLRLPLIVGDSRTGRFILKYNHLMLRYLFILKTGLMPSNPFPMNIIPVDICAKASIQLFFDERSNNDIINVMDTRPAMDQQFVVVAERLGYTVNIVEFSEFIQKLQESTDEDSPFAMFKEFYRSESDLMALYTTAPALKEWIIMGQDGDTVFTSKKLRQLLPEFQSKLEGDMEYIYRDLMFCRKQGWLENYGLK